jgi:hypothetical protein
VLPEEETLGSEFFDMHLVEFTGRVVGPGRR